MSTYTGSGPYCYANSLAMALGPAAPPVAVVETLTGSAFGAQLPGGGLPFFDPYGWDPEQGLDAAVELLGLGCVRTADGSAAEAAARLRAACAVGPVLVGPVDLGLLPYRPGTPARGEGDHYVVVLDLVDGVVLLHDPEGHPYATSPLAAFTEAWRAETVEYTDVPFVMRSGFTRRREVTVERALRRSLPRAAEWLSGRGGGRPSPPGSLGGAAAVEALAELVGTGLDPAVREHLAGFAVRVGARRLADAAHCLGLLRLPEAAAEAARQARLLGGLQHPLVTGDDAALAAGLRLLAPGYERLRGRLLSAVAAGADGTPG
ncbi:hypothetical protein GCM10010232_58390 [Streptomyces amakusaensis]|uniref:Uncharacterized protein n=1 Tax=Streptomyces amakusaensis TaxID=67271 RepID=A0ABW0AU21_9ACTN